MRHSAKSFHQAFHIFWLPTLLLCTFAGCMSKPQPESGGAQGPNGKGTPRSSRSGGPDSSMATTFSVDAKTLGQELKLIEMSFAKRNCQQVLEHGRLLGIIVGKEKNHPVPQSTALALAVCECEAAPKDKDKLKTAQNALDAAIKNLTPAFDASFLENLRADIYLAAGDKDKALKAKRRAREFLVSLDKNIMQFDADILELGNALASLNEAQRAKFKDSITLSRRDDQLSDALRAIDELLSQVNNPDARVALVEHKSLIQSRQEQLFSLEASQLESKKTTGTREPEAREQAQELRKRFPARHFQVRIDAIMGENLNTTGSPTAVVPAAENRSLSAPANAASPATSAPVGVEAGTAEKALIDARTALDSGNAEKAVEILDSLPEAEKSERTRRLKREAADVHVRELRMRVRDLYNRATSQSDKQIKLDALRQCKQILETILTRYPDQSGRSGVERNLKTIVQDIEEIGKAK